MCGVNKTGFQFQIIYIIFINVYLSIIIFTQTITHKHTSHISHKIDPANNYFTWISIAGGSVVNTGTLHIYHISGLDLNPVNWLIEKLTPVCMPVKSDLYVHARCALINLSLKILGCLFIILMISDSIILSVHNECRVMSINVINFAWITRNINYIIFSLNVLLVICKTTDVLFYLFK